MKLRLFFAALAVSTLCFTTGALLTPAHAQLNTGLNEVGNTIKLTATDPRIIAGRIINIALGVIGIILLTLILYAGFLWMTSGGDAAKIEKAQHIIRNAIIGLIIILMSWAIAYYVINVLLNVTGGGGGGGGGSGGGGGGGLGGGGAVSFRITAASPQGDQNNPYNTNAKINVTFSQDINPDIPKNWQNYVKVTTQANVSVNGTWELVGNNAKWMRFTPPDNCPEDAKQKCFAKNTLFQVSIDKSKFTSAAKEALFCGGLYPACDFKFYIGDKMDSSPPNVTITDLYDYQSFCNDKPYISVPAKAVDDFGVSIMQWLEDDVAWDSDGPTSIPTPKEFSSAMDWSTVGKILKQPYKISVKATDTDNNTGSQSLHLIVLKNHCCNKIKDGDELDVDCGGKDCLSCSNAPCSDNAQCASGFCENGVCINKPVITNVSPTSGKDGTFVSIWGANFGDTGTTTFMGPPTIQAHAPQACVALGVKTWTNNYILVEVPKEAKTGPIQVYNATSKLSDRTDKDPGPILPDFNVNNVIRPGICLIKPDTGKSGIDATLIGGGFGPTQGDRVIGFGAKTLIPQTKKWTNENVVFVVPDLYAGYFGVGIKNKSGDPISNSVPFNLQAEPPEVAPTISAITPNHGPTGQYVTIVGQHFGSSQGLVKFVDIATNSEISGDANFPQSCGSLWWTDSQVVVKVPTMVDQNGKVIQPLSPGSNPNFKVYILRNSKDNKLSNRVDFLFSSDALGPGICRISPTAGPTKTVVQIYGERFGTSKGPSDQVVFANNAAADTYNNWGPEEIDVVVPSTAVTGKMFIKSAAPPQSNDVQFLVGDCRDLPNLCSANQLCCPGGSCASDKCPSASYQAMYGWQMTTGIIPRSPSIIQNCQLNPATTTALIPPSPSPSSQWPGGDSVCTGQAKIGVMFDMPVVGDSTALQSLFKLMQCTGKGADPCLERTPVDIVSFTKQPTIHLNGNVICSQPPDIADCRDYITFEPKSKLPTNATFEVYVLQGVQSVGQFGDKMQEDKSCAEPGSGACFRFKTRNDDNACEVGFVYVSPYSTAVEGAQLKPLPYEALPVTKDAVCNLLSCKGFNWSWSTRLNGKPTTLASMASLQTEVYNGQTYVSCHQGVVPGEQEATNPPVEVAAKEVVSAKEGIGDLFIKRLIPQVIDHSPDCNQACLNAYIWARFNTSLKPSTINYKNVQVYKCANENCLEKDLVGDLAKNLSEKYNFQIKLWPDQLNIDSNLLSESFGTSTVRTNSFILVDPRDRTDPNNSNPPLILEAGKFYLVRLKGGTNGAIASQYDTLLPQDFVWKFRTAIGDKAYCTPDHLMVYPSKAIENRVGDHELFQSKVFSAPDECRSDGQMLLVTKNFTWNFVDEKHNLDIKQLVAKYDPYSKGINADGALPKGCSSDCRATGSDGVYGVTARCGNGIVETTDDVYCDPLTKLTKAGQPCQIMPMISGAGEECDGNLADATCNSNTCLWMDTLTINKNGTCGNFVTDLTKGEMCDPGLRCFDTTTSTVASGTPCDSSGQTDNITSAVCQAAGGKCEIRNYLGCSSGCKNLGASSVQSSVCGNGSIGYGEDCDQGSNNGTSGCSADCLHRGSSSSVGALCHNGVLELGETCESSGPGEPLPAYCDPIKCIKLGNQDFGTVAGKCGDGVVDVNKGEECDDGNHLNGDGCSAVCLNEGSSWRYDEPSLCGNGIKEKGETCEAPKGNGLIAPIQIAEIIGKGVPDEDKIKKTHINVEYSGVKAEATFGIRCGLTSESACGPNGLSIDPDYGLDKDGCCNLRPKKIESYPASGSQDVCRNTMISVKFNSEMDAPSVENNFVVAKEISETKCPTGTILLSEVTPQIKGLWNWLAAKWHSLVKWLKGEPAYAGIWCGNMVAGQLQASTSTKEFYYTLGEALDANTRYIVRLGGTPFIDLPDLSKHIGIKTKDGVVAFKDVGDLNSTPPQNWNYTWWFQTGKDICRINSILVEDLDPEHPAYFQKANEQHPFRGTALALHNGKVEKLSPVNQYQWKWWGWTSNALPIADIVPGSDVETGSVAEATVGAKTKNGSAIISAGLEVTSDTIDGEQKLSQSQVLFGALPIMVFICDNPWPELSKAPFRDMDPVKDSPLPHVNTLKDTIFEKGPFFNFQTMYCRDSDNGLLPELEVNPVPLSNIDKLQGILRQYLLTFKEPTFKHDGIGIRVMSNLYHDTLREWYVRQGFTGSPQSIKVDGYEALKDAGTVYVSFPNTIDVGHDIFQNILVISHNLDAFAETSKVFDQMVESLAFNINFAEDNTNTCLDNKGLPTKYAFDSKTTQLGATLTKGRPIVCAADFDCATVSTSTHCASYKYKLQRDLMRLQDFSTFKSSLKSYYSTKGYYPQLSEGTFLYGRTNSRWPSWNETLAQVLGLGDAIPVDPVNRFLSCGYCLRKSDSQLMKDLPCTVVEDCPSDAYTCEADGGFDPQTCWNVAQRQFLCPDIYPGNYVQVPHSNFYSYRASEGGRRFEVAANFEVPPPNPNDLKNWWYPEFLPNIKVCYTSSTLSDGKLCQTDDDCKPCVNPYDTNNCKAAAPAGSCRTLGAFKYRDLCNNEKFGEGGVCGDGITGQVCKGGAKNGQGCKLGSDCPGGQCVDEICELGQTHIAQCKLGNITGTKLQVCDACLGWTDDPKISVCRETAVCGNGRIDKWCSGGVYDHLACSSGNDCTDSNGSYACVPALIGIPPHAEACDDGVLNGTYGHCSTNCTGIDKYCGNNKLDPGENCDRGVGPGGNGIWCKNKSDCYGYLNIPNISYDQSCSSNCQDKAPYCGDGQVYPDSAFEECDGNILATTGKICAIGDKKEQPCQTNADCPISGSFATTCVGYQLCGGCPGDTKHDSCAGTKVGRCATAAMVCVDNAQMPLFLSKGWFATAHTYTQCNSLSDCANGQTCVAMANAGGSEGGCTINNDSQCTVGNVSGKCIQYDTAHIRQCNAPGTPTQCKYEPFWSECRPQHLCGDGVIDAGQCIGGSKSGQACNADIECPGGSCSGEECDDGSNNASFNACLPTCKKNTCGDGSMWNNVEECDNGVNNGKKVCKAQYQSTCNDCTLQCKNMTASGGYCGNNIVEANEQCDGNDEIQATSSYSPSAMSVGAYSTPHYILQTDLIDNWQWPQAKDYMGSLDPSKDKVKVLKNSGPINCQALGYDFAINSWANAAIYINKPAITLVNNVPGGLFVGYWGSEAGDIYSQILAGKPPRVLNLAKDKLFTNQNNTLLNTIFDVCGLIQKAKNTDGIYDFFWRDPSEWPTRQGFWNCVNNFGSKYGFEVKGQANDKPYCGLNCQITGCGKCTDEGGTGKISGIVYRNGWSGGLIIPDARVTLQYNGINVSQLFTDGAGKFEFSGLNDRAECSNYRLIVDKTENGTYATVTSNEFNVNNFSTQVIANVCDSTLIQCPIFYSALVMDLEIPGQSQQP